MHLRRRQLAARSRIHASPATRRSTLVRAALAGAVLLSFVWTGFVLRAALSGTAAEEPPPLEDTDSIVAVTDAPTMDASPNLRGASISTADWRDSSLHRCEYIRDLISRKDELAIGEPLPEPGKARGSVTFWLKRPVLHARDPETGNEIMVLLYNIYNHSPSWTQHTDKFTNTVKTLLSAGNQPLFPKLYGFCEDLDGHHYIAVEYIDFDMFKVPPPTNLHGCVDRAVKAVELFAHLDDDLHLVLADFKPGQWMARRDGSLVLQDVDDVVAPGSKSTYKDQVEWHQSRLRHFHGLSKEEMNRVWFETLFPRGELSSRYASINMDLLLDNLGFRWSRHCSETAEFRNCREAVLQWARTLEDEWPSPQQIANALRECEATNTFERTRRMPAIWRDFPPAH